MRDGKMEATATVTERPHGAARRRRGLPPGPRMRRALQTAIWSRRAQWMLEQCRARFGADVHPQHRLRRHLGDRHRPRGTSSRSSPATRASSTPARATRSSSRCSARTRSCVLDEKPHISQRKLLLPPFHGERMQGYEEKMTEIAAREIESWPLGTPYKLRPRMQAMTLEIILETVFGVHGGERMEELRVALRDFLDLTTNPLLLAPLRPRRARPGRGASRPSAAASSASTSCSTARSPSAGPPRTSRSATTSSRCWSPPATRTAAR